MKFEVVDPTDPFPILDRSERDYGKEKLHAARVDKWLGLAIPEIESDLTATAKQIPRSAEFWIGLEAQAFLTPYTEIREILENVRPDAGSHFIDLGAGYGRVGHVLARHFPSVRFTGFEVVRERCREAQRVFDQWKYHPRSMYEADLSSADFQPSDADSYFIYDYSTVASVRKTLADLQLVGQRRGICVIARGRGVRSLIDRENPWLSSVVRPRHFDRYSIYKNR